MGKWYQIQAKGKTQAEISILDEIGLWGIGADQFIRDVKALGDVDEITLMINSPGGAVFEGYTIYNYLNRHPATVTVVVMGVAASIASVVAMAGDRIEMPENAMMMIHKPFGGCVGTADDMLSLADALEKVEVGIISSYRKKTGMPDEELAKMMAAETWITAKEAVEMGFADVVTDEVKMAAVFDLKSLKGYQNVPESLIAGISNNAGKPKKGEAPMEITVDLLKAEHPEIVTALQAEVNTDEIRAAGVAEGEKAGAENERARIQAVRDQLMPGHEDLIAKLMFDGVTTGPEAAVKVLAAQKELMKNHLEDLDDDAPDPVSDLSTDGDLGGADEGGTIEEKCKKTWDKDGKLRAEYEGDFEAYVAYETALVNGQIKSLKNK